MKKRNITCALCGHQYDPIDHPTCERCPLQSGCSLTCCPQCGYESVDPQGSVAVRWLKKLFSPQSDNRDLPEDLTLAQVPPGREAEVKAFDPRTSPFRKTHLQAYGVSPGHTVRVLQHKPVTVVKVDHLELALEDELAEKIQVWETNGEKEKP